MLPLRYSARWQLAGVLLLMAVLTFSMLPTDGWWSGTEDDWFQIEHFDKWLHGLTFLTLSVWFGGMVRKHAYWKLALGLLAFGLFIEACQFMVVYRMAESIDVAADAIGIMAGLMIGILGTGGWCQSVEERLAKH